MSERWSLRYWTKAECCGEPVNLVGPIVLLTNFNSDHISSALGKSAFWNGSASPFWERVRDGPAAQLLNASAASEAPEATMNSRREIDIVSSAALLLRSAPNDPLSWATLSVSDQIVVRRSQPHRVYGKRALANHRYAAALSSVFRCLSSQPIIIRL